MDSITITHDPNVTENSNDVNFRFRLRILYFYVKSKDSLGKEYSAEYSMSVCLSNNETPSIVSQNIMKNKYFCLFQKFLEHNNISYICLDIPSPIQHIAPALSMWNVPWDSNDNKEYPHFLFNQNNGRKWANENGFKVWMKDKIYSWK